MKPILWCRLESSTSKELINNYSVVVTGAPTFSSGKFGNGAYSNNNSHYINITSIPLSKINNGAKYTIELWLKTDYNVTNGIPADGLVHDVFSFLTDTSQQINFYFYPADAFYFDATVGPGYYKRITAPTWTASNLIHFAFVFNKDGIDGGSDKIRVYVGNSLIFNSSSFTSGSYVDLTGTSFTLRLLGRAGSYVFKGQQDNIKIYDYAKTNFLDKENERGGMNDIVQVGI